MVIRAYATIPKNPQKTVYMRWLRQERYRLHQSVCCRHTQHSPSRQWCPSVCPSWGELSGRDLGPNSQALS